MNAKNYNRINYNRIKDLFNKGDYESLNGYEIEYYLKNLIFNYRNSHEPFQKEKYLREWKRHMRNLQTNSIELVTSSKALS